ncbi:MAG: PD40 domain-containing protein [Chloroflexi bacterium]|nr:PD40 domain-containing protein [Chloroflexota bacterium]
MKQKNLFRLRWLTPLILFGMIFSGLLPQHSPIALAVGCTTGTMYRVSINTGGATPGNNNSDPARISSDGRFIVFESASDNLVANDTNGVNDIFVFDQLNCTTNRVSLSSAGLQSNERSTNPQISSDGRYVAYQSLASNLVSGDTNTVEDIFVRDRQTNITSRVSVSTAGAQATGGPSFNPVISGDGRYVAYESSATNIVAGDTNGFTDIFMRDIVGNTTTLISVNSSGTIADEESREPAITSDGRIIAFSSFASNLVANDTNDPDIFIRDLSTNTTSLVSVATGGSQVPDNFSELGPEISADGRFVVFVSTAAFDVVDTNGVNDIYLRDRSLGTTSLISVNTAGGAADSESSNPSVSTDGTLVTFESSATNLIASDTENQLDVFLRNVPTNTTTRISQDPTSGVGGNLSSFRASISTDGRYIAFTSNADNLIGTGNDVNLRTDVFIFDRQISSGVFFAPANLAATAVSRSQINLTWVDNATSETGFSIEQSLNGTDGWLEVGTRTANQISFQNTGLLCNRRYYYRVRAFIDSIPNNGQYETVSAYTNIVNAITQACLPHKLAIFQYQTGQASLLLNFNTPAQSGDRNTFASGAPAAAAGGTWVMGDWDADSVKTVGVLGTNGVFYYTNTSGASATWNAVWIGFQGGRPIVAGRFDPTRNNDCVGAVDSVSFPPYGRASSLYYTCVLTNGTAPTLGVQWLSVVLPDSQGHSGTYQYCASDFNNDRLDSVAIRRGQYVAWTNRAPAPPEPGQQVSLSAYDQAQYIGVPEASTEGLFTCGDWDNDGISTFGILYQTTGNFFRRPDLLWNSGAWTVQQVGTPLSISSIASGSWR